MFGDQRGAFVPRFDQVTQPLARAFVECRDRCSGREPQHVAQAMHLPRIESNGAAGGQWPRNVKTRRATLGQMSLPTLGWRLEPARPRGQDYRMTNRAASQTLSALQGGEGGA